jgi:hypothetical protein
MGKSGGESINLSGLYQRYREKETTTEISIYNLIGN